ncbi:hypothetical protein BO83DRAFT_194027 [Aspergillus eucalypticola CBS 122712]|uniref:Uncharacterized protein n=1 Tax=Aspergillus eucalypticola (strain CBS 122712 / IBT 29274) TaxID=1448314 RepID=A0A317ULK8_ASPEC|nr:uncharacterized protein BO83DRAFT_194027 [Aspergillus eucalypticola CBS 122712]PWY62078.1 hypothetical protein BO83DRAFT_194027 [Aspergillus eucalypticola CBS 122712]
MTSTSDLAGSCRTFNLQSPIYHVVMAASSIVRRFAIKYDTIADLVSLHCFRRVPNWVNSTRCADPLPFLTLFILQFMAGRPVDERIDNSLEVFVNITILLKPYWGGYLWMSSVDNRTTWQGDEQPVPCMVETSKTGLTRTEMCDAGRSPRKYSEWESSCKRDSRLRRKQREKEVTSSTWPSK